MVSPDEDEIYPRQPDKPMCAAFAKKGRCHAFDSESVCPWDHQPENLHPSVLCLYLDRLDEHHAAIAKARSDDDSKRPNSSGSTVNNNQSETHTHLSNNCWFCGVTEGATVAACACIREFKAIHPGCLRDFRAATGFDSCSLCGQSYCEEGREMAQVEQCDIPMVKVKRNERDPWEEPLSGLELPGSDEIWDRIFLGSMEAASDLEALKAAGVTAIIDVSRRENPRFEDLDYLTLHIRDHPEEDITVLFDECFDFIRKTLQAGGAILVHCKFGRSRSATIVIAYLMLYEDICFREAITLSVDRRPETRPNGGFIQQLLKFEKEVEQDF